MEKKGGKNKSQQGKEEKRKGRISVVDMQSQRKQESNHSLTEGWRTSCIPIPKSSPFSAIVFMKITKMDILIMRLRY